MELPFDDLYRLLAENHSGIVDDLLDKVKTAEAKELLEKLGCYDFILKRVEKFENLRRTPQL